jgi:hypothetical protein
MVGLTEAKAVINKALDYYKAQKLFASKGMPLSTELYAYGIYRKSRYCQNNSSQAFCSDL